MNKVKSRVTKNGSQFWESARSHFKLVCTHKYHVGKACFKAGIPFRGIKHDLSKFSPIEFFESAKWYSGDRSPIDNCKDVQGYSLAWFHHRGRNRHHWEYWVDNFEKGMTPTLMPFDDALEMLCDFIGAGKAYMKENFSWDGEYRWWTWKRERVIMHPVIWHFIDQMLWRFKAENSDNSLNYRKCRILYIQLQNQFDRGELAGMYKSVVKT